MWPNEQGTLTQVTIYDATAVPCEPVHPRTRALLLAVRQGLIIILGALEDYLQMERSIVPRRKR